MFYQGTISAKFTLTKSKTSPSWSLIQTMGEQQTLPTPKEESEEVTSLSRPIQWMRNIALATTSVAKELRRDSHFAKLPAAGHTEAKQLGYE